MNRYKVLIVDDDETSILLLKNLLKDKYTIESAGSGEEALKLVCEFSPDLILLDVIMPGIDGLEVLRQVRKAYPNIQVIILTGHGSEKHEEEAKRLGAFDYLEKPVNLDVLVKKMKAAYRRKMEDTMVAATFAEAGDFESAKKIMDEDD
jgi:DNA-binding response OmpR family regulator